MEVVEWLHARGAQALINIVVDSGHSKIKRLSHVIGSNPKMMLSAKAGGEHTRAPSGAFVVSENAEEM